MCPRVFTFRIALSLTICTSLLLIPVGPVVVSDAAQGRGAVRPKPGKPEGILPNLGEVQKESPHERGAPPPIPSTIRSKKNSGKPWDGRRVGDPEPQDHRTERGSAGSIVASNTKRINELRSTQTRRAHASRLMPPPVPENQFVQNFFTWALTVSPSAEETTYWHDQLRVAHAQGQDSLKLAAIELGRTLFESATYADRNRDAHEYVHDLYKTYLMRDPDPGGWATWELLVPTHGREYVRRGFEESGEFATVIANITLSGPPSSNAASLISARVDPRNQPGNGMLTRDTSWSVPLLSLPGRAGLDLGLTLSYSSMVWTRSDQYIYFDEDNGFPSPGFRLGFPTVQRKVSNAQTAKNAYLMITAAGHRVELRHVSANIYDAADSSYLRLTEDGALLRVHSTDGTRLTFSEANGQYRCKEVKDRNGNYITINYNALGQITNITDTLGRLITFNYDGNANPLSITQMWGTQTHTWATFGWASHTMHPSFGTLRVVGTADNAVLPVLKQVGLPDGNRYEFEYTNAAQVSAIRRYRADHTQPFYTVFQYEPTTTDCPRLNQTRVAAENWTSLNEVPGEVTTHYAVDPDGACRMTAPDGTIYKEYYGTGWQKGLTTLSEVWSGGVKKKWTTTAWTQDNTAVGYEVNPRITEINVEDGTNRRRTEIGYGPYAQYGLPYMVREYAADAVTPVRDTFTDYNLSQAYLDRRIIGLVSEVHVTNISSWQRKLVYSYDNPSQLQAVPAAATQHDPSYSTSLTTRGNLTAVARWDVNDITNPAKALTTQRRYNTTGAVVATIDPAGHENTLSYTDSFSDDINRNTFAYPTKLTDADSFSSDVEYNFNFGAKTRTEGPPPAEQPQGAIQTIDYDSVGRVERVTTVNNGAYTRYVYGPNFVQSFSTVNNVADEAYNIQVFDGVGRVIGSAGNHPGSTGGYRAQMTLYDLMGRADKTSNPTEMTDSWVPAGDDAAGWVYTKQTYDWQDRPLVTTNTDLTTREASYTGCGCAGGEVVTITDEGTLDSGVAKRRQQKIYSDVLGRAVKTEVLNWQGGTVYSTTLNTYNARDQITSVKVYDGSATTDGSCPSGTCQETVTAYDGYARLKTRHLPQQDAGTNTVWDYNADGTIHKIIDSRGASQTLSYNARHLITGIAYAAPAPIPSSTPVSYGYDAAGNRKSMTDEVGSATYTYDQLSRLKSESRTFGTVGPLTITYEYNLADELKKITDPTNMGIAYTYDNVGRQVAISGQNTLYGGVTQYASNLSYRAWNALKSMTYGNDYTSALSYNARLLPSQFEVTKPPQLGSTAVMKTQYHYYSDASLKFADRLTTLGQGFDRAFSYDHVSMLKEAYTGGEARDHMYGTTGGGPGPYRQTYQHDAFGNLTNRTSRYWGEDDLFSANYLNNRRQDPNWQFDADGRLKQDGTLQYHYDAAGENRSIYNPELNSTTTFIRDGDGRQIKRIDAPPGISVTTYYLRSSVLGGRIIAELSSTGQKLKGYVFAGTEVVAFQEFGSVTWKHVEPLTGSSGQSIQNGTFTSTAELDPSGVNIGVTNPFLNPPEFSPEPFLPMLTGDEGSCGSNPNCVRCYFHGARIPCAIAGNMMTGGLASVDPEKTSPSALERLAAQPVYGTFCVDAPVATVGSTAPSSAVGMGAAPPASPSSSGRTCVTELTGYTEGTMSNSMNLIPLQPQNPPGGEDIRPRNLLGHIFTLLDNNQCSTFVSNLINVARQLTGKKPLTYDGKELAVAVANQPNGGFIFRPGSNGGGGSGSAYGDVFSGEATAEIVMFNTTFGPRHPVGVNYSYALAALHELVHLAGGAASVTAGSRAYYMDVVLARAAHILTGAPGYPEGYNPNVPWWQISANMTAAAGVYWDKQLSEHCTPQEYR